jgi:hypothetical protein
LLDISRHGGRTLSAIPRHLKPLARRTTASPLAEKEEEEKKKEEEEASGF